MRKETIFSSLVVRIFLVAFALLTLGGLIFYDQTDSSREIPTAAKVESTPIVTTPEIIEAEVQSEINVVELLVTALETPTATSNPTAQVTSTPKPTIKTPTPIPTTVAPTATPTATPTPTTDYSKPWTVAPGCPSTTLACVPCTSGSTCRYEPGKSHGFIGWACQNNNPGNIRNASTNMATDFKNGIITRNGGIAACGVRYDSRGGSYFVFSSYSAGYGALKAYVKGINKGEHSSYTNCGDCTIAFFFSKYAPGDSSYASYVASYIGLTPEHTLRNVIDGNKLDGFVDAIKNHEGFFVQ